MKRFSAITLWAAVLGLLVMPTTLSAAGGFLLATPEFGSDLPATCDGSSLLTPDSGGMLFALRSFSGSDSDPAEDDMLWHMYNGGSVGPGPTSCDWQGPGGFANWQCFNNNFTPQPGSGQTVWGIVALYPSGSDMGVHEGWLMIDNSPGADIDATRPQTPQRLRVPVAVPGAVPNDGDPNSGFDVSMEYVTEFSAAADVGACFAGGNTDQTGFDGRVIAGFNVYRLATADVDPATSTPMHYLCGPDADCTDVSDTGWVGFIPLDPSSGAGVSIDSPGDVTADPATFPVGVVDRGGANVSVLFSDKPAALDAEYSWVFQPVIRVNNVANLGDWNGFAAMDLNGDGQPEFVDPSGTGLGLCANGATAGGDPMILVSREAVADGGDLGTTPALGSLDLNATLDREGRGVRLTFLSSIEGDVVGFNLFRSLDGRGFAQINDTMISAKGTPLSDYVYTDNVNVRRLKSGTIHYKVQVQLSDGSSAFYGPYTVNVGQSAPAPRQRRR